MTILPPNKAPENSGPAIRITHEGNGLVLACADCLWVRYCVNDASAREAEAEHAKKCKGGAK